MGAFIGSVIAAFVGLFVMLWMFSVNVGPGEEIVLIDRPIMFGHGGIEPRPEGTGRVFMWPTTTYLTVDKRPLQYEEHFDDLMSLDGVPLDFDAALRLKIRDSVNLVEKFGEKWYENNIKVEFRNRVRQAVRKHGMNETAINTTAIDAIDKEVSEAIDTYLKAANIPVDLVQITVGKANPPDAIKTQRIETASQQQRRLTEDQRKLAEDSRLEAEKSRAAADNAYRNAMSLTPEQFVAMEGYKVQREVCHDGHCTFVIGTNGAPSVLVAPPQTSATSGAK